MDADWIIRRLPSCEASQDIYPQRLTKHWIFHSILHAPPPPPPHDIIYHICHILYMSCIIYTTYDISTPFSSSSSIFASIHSHLQYLTCHDKRKLFSEIARISPVHCSALYKKVSLLTFTHSDPSTIFDESYFWCFPLLTKMQTLVNTQCSHLWMCNELNISQWYQVCCDPPYMSPHAPDVWDTLSWDGGLWCNEQIDQRWVWQIRRYAVHPRRSHRVTLPHPSYPLLS